MATEKSFLGVGWKFPPSFDKTSNSILKSSGVADIEESILIILQTVPGERVMQPEFGCNINKLVFESMTTLIDAELHDMIYNALLIFEPRIKDIDTVIADKDFLSGIIKVNITYTIISTNTRHNIVFPFYLLEGTNVR